MPKLSCISSDNKSPNYQCYETARNNEMPINEEVTERAREILKSTSQPDSADYEKLYETIKYNAAIMDLIMDLVDDAGRANVVLDMKLYKIVDLAKHANKINAAVETIAMSIATDESE